jgi:hypothetical protein
MSSPADHGVSARAEAATWRNSWRISWRKRIDNVGWTTATRQLGRAVAGRWQELLACGALLVGIYVTLSTAVMIARYWGRIPVGDSWDELITGRDITWSWLISLHNEHRLLFSRLITLADFWLSAENNVVNFAFGSLMMAAFAFLVVRLARGAGLARTAETTWATGLTLALLLWSIQFEILIWGLPLVQFVGMMVAATLTFAALASAPPTLLALVGVVALGLVSAYIMANGILVLWIAAALAAWLGRRPIHIVILLVAAFAVTATYLIGYRTPAVHSDPAEFLSHLGAILTYALAYLGGPFGASVGWLLGSDQVALAIAAGAAGIVIFAVLGLWLLSDRRRHAPQAAALFALATFVLASGLLVALGRVILGLDQALSSRYASQVLPFWVALALIGAAAGGRRQLAVMLLAVPPLAIVALSQRHYVGVGRTIATGRDAAGPALLTGVADPLINQLHYFNPEGPLHKRELLRAAHTSIFADRWAGWLGRPLAEHAVLSEARLCQGSLDRAVQVATGAFAGWRAMGRAHSLAGERAARRIVLVDGAGLVVGYGVGGLGLDAVIAGLQPDGGKDTRWIGAFVGADPGAVTAYALLDDMPTACPIGTARSIIRQPVRLALSNARPRDLTPGGYVDSISILPQRIVIAGWGMIAADGARVLIDTNMPIRSFELATSERPDVVAALRDPRLAASGISVRLEIDTSQRPPDRVTLCVWTEDAARSASPVDPVAARAVPAGRRLTMQARV